MVFREHENELETTKLELEFNKLKVDQKKFSKGFFSSIY
jgi:hypothetical protein